MTNSKVERGGRNSFKSSLLHRGTVVHNDLLSVSKEAEDFESSQHKAILITPI